MSCEEAFTEISKIKITALVQAAMSRTKSIKMKSLYLSSLGANKEQIRWKNLVDNQKNVKDEEVISKYMKNMDLDIFLKAFEHKVYGIQCLSKLMMRYLRQQPLLDPDTRFRLWLTMTRTDKNLKMYDNYYKSLTGTLMEPFKEFTHIISLDVNRTPQAQGNAELHSQLTNILLSYAKYANVTKTQL